MDSVITFGAKYLFIAVVLLWAMAWLQANRNYKKQMSLATFIAVIIAGVLDKIASKAYYDPRPFVTHNVRPLVAHVADNGFPSEHTLFSMVLAVTLVFYRPKLGWTAGAIAIAVGLARVAAHVHSPIDIVGGIVIGFAAGYAGYWIVARYLPVDKKPMVKRGADRPADPR